MQGGMVIEERDPEIEQELSFQQSENGTSPADTLKAFLGPLLTLEIVGGLGGGVNIPQPGAEPAAPAPEIDFSFDSLTPPTGNMGM